MKGQSRSHLRWCRRVLDLIRQGATPNLCKAVRAEMDKALMKMPVHEIERHFAA